MDDYERNPYRGLINRETPKKTIIIHVMIDDFVQWTREQSTYDAVVFAVRTGRHRLPDNDKTVMADYMASNDTLELNFNDPNDIA